MPLDCPAQIQKHQDCKDDMVQNMLQPLVDFYRFNGKAYKYGEQGYVNQVTWFPSVKATTHAQESRRRDWSR